MPSAVQQQHILIVGAGLTGLIIAQGLKKAGIPYSVFEAEEANLVRPKEWNMGLHWSLPLLKEFMPEDIMARLTTEGTVDPSLDYTKNPWNGAYVYDGVSGKVVKDLSVADPIVRVSRRRLRTLFAEGIEVHNSHVIDRIETDEETQIVTAHFTNGKSYSGTLLVGADGPKSFVRGKLFESNPEAGLCRPVEGIVNQSMCYSYADPEVARYVRTIHPVWSMCLHPELLIFHSVQECFDNERPETWKFFTFVTWLGERDEHLDAQGRIQLMKHKAQGLAEPWRTAMLNIPDETKFTYSDVGYWIAQPWDTKHGMVTLAGDAAHPMPPFRGQGLNHAIQDVYNLLSMIKTREVAGSIEQENLVAEYSDEAAARGAEETQTSLKNGKMMAHYDQFANSPYNTIGLVRAA